MIPRQNKKTEKERGRYTLAFSKSLHERSCISYKLWCTPSTRKYDRVEVSKSFAVVLTVLKKVCSSLMHFRNSESVNIQP